MGRKKFAAAPNGPYSDADMAACGPELLKLEGQLGHRLRPTEVVDAARSPKSALHTFFDWNLRQAAEKHWLHTARQMIRSVRVYCVDDKGRDLPVKQFFNVRLFDGEKVRRAYITTERAQSEPELLEQIIDGALMEAKRWADRHSLYEQLADIRIAIYGTIKRRRKPQKKKKKKLQTVK